MCVNLIATDCLHVVFDVFNIKYVQLFSHYHLTCIVVVFVISFKLTKQHEYAFAICCIKLCLAQQTKGNVMRDTSFLWSPYNQYIMLHANEIQ